MIRSVVPAALLLLTAACFSERARLDVPVVTVELVATQVAPGATIEGRVSARDASGVVRMGVRVTMGDSVVRQERSGSRAPEAELVFSVDVPGGIAHGSTVEVLGWARDDQDFRVQVADTVRVVFPLRAR